MSETILIENATINGVLEEVGDCGYDGRAAIIMRTSNGEKLTLSVSEEDCKAVGGWLYQEFSIVFDAKIKFGHE